jgi:hypothetical protein
MEVFDMPHLDARISIMSEEALLASHESDARIDMMHTLTANGEAHAVHINNLQRGKRFYCLLHARESKNQPFDIPLAMVTATLKQESLTVDPEELVPVVDLSNIKLNKAYTGYNIVSSLIGGTVTSIENSLKRQGKAPLVYAQLYLPQDSPMEDAIEQSGFLPLTQAHKYHPARLDTLYVKPTCLTFEQKSQMYNQLTLATNKETVSSLAVKYIQMSNDNCLAHINSQTETMRDPHKFENPIPR